MTYMIILQPTKEKAEQYVHWADRLFGEKNLGHFLAKGKMPHITICQFDCEAQEQAIELLKEIKPFHPNPFTIQFNSLSLVPVKDSDAFWAELSVAFDPRLLEFQARVRSTIQSKGFLIQNDYKEGYRPHLTLAQIKLPYTIQRWPNTLLSLEPFYLNYAVCAPS